MYYRLQPDKICKLSLDLLSHTSHLCAYEALDIEVLLQPDLNDRLSHEHMKCRCEEMFAHAFLLLSIANLPLAVATRPQPLWDQKPCQRNEDQMFKVWYFEANLKRIQICLSAHTCVAFEVFYPCSLVYICI